MTLKYMQGFETMRDNTDLVTQGWAQGVSAYRAAFVPSVTSVGGVSMHAFNASAPGAQATAVGAAAAPDPGYFNTGVTVNQAYTAGGFTLGGFLRLNSGVSATIGASQPSNNNQICFDGTRYWSIQAGASSNVVTSTNLQTWTATPSQPTTSSALSSIFYLGGGVVAFIQGANGTATPRAVFYTNNAGATWNTYLSPNTSAGPFAGTGIATTNSAFPHLLSVAMTSVTTGVNGIYVGTISGTMTQVVVQSGAGNTSNALNAVRIIDGLIITASNAGGTTSGAIVSATASNSALNTTAAWTSAPITGTTSALNDIAYNPVSNLFVIATGAGIFTFPNSGAAGTPVGPTGTVTVTSRYSTAEIQNVFWTGAQLVAIGIAGHIITSPDGIVWTESGGHLISVGTNGYDWRCAINDGTRYVLTSDTTSGIVATTPDLVTNFAVQYVSDTGRPTPSANIGCFGMYSGTAPSTAGVWTANSNFTGLNVGTFAASTPITVVNSGTTFGTFNVSTATTLGHYYEMVFTPVSGTVNSFNMTLFVDGTQAGTFSAIPMASSTTDTTSLLVIVLSRRLDFNAYDDIYFTLTDGLGIVGPLGVVNIVAQRPETDVTDTWVKSGSASNNSLSTNQSALSSLSTNFVSSANAGDKDVYGTTDTLPAGFVPKAVMVEAYFTKTSTTAPLVDVGLSSGGTETDSAQVSITSTTPTYVSQIVQTNPNGSVPWTASTVNAADFVLNHVT